MTVWLCLDHLSIRERLRLCWSILLGKRFGLMNMTVKPEAPQPSKEQLQ